MSDKHCYALLLSYDGAAFTGFQKQAPFQTVQESLERALAATGLPVQVEGGGRTDAGVHARGQVVTFRTRESVDAAALPAQLAPHLPAGLQVLQAVEAPYSFHARWSARAKIYRYRVSVGPAPSEWEERCTWRLPDLRGFPDLEQVEALDEEAMRGVLAASEGWHDFKNLAHPRTSGKTRRLLLSARLEVQQREAGGRLYELTWQSPGFLRHQVRNMTGMTVAAGLGRLDAAAMEQLLSGKGDRWRGPRAPGRGLTLWQVIYPPAEDPFAATAP